MLVDKSYPSIIWALKNCIECIFVENVHKLDIEVSFSIAGTSRESLIISLDGIHSPITCLSSSQQKFSPNFGLARMSPLVISRILMIITSFFN